LGNQLECSDLLEVFLFAKDGKLYNALQFKKFYDKESVTMVKSQKTLIFL
jgi:hypothetical protein